MHLEDNGGRNYSIPNNIMVVDCYAGVYFSGPINMSIHWNKSVQNI